MSQFLIALNDLSEGILVSVKTASGIGYGSSIYRIMHQVLIKIFQLEGIVGCKFESRQMWLKCRSGGKLRLGESFLKYKRKKKAKRELLIWKENLELWREAATTVSRFLDWL